MSRTPVRERYQPPRLSPFVGVVSALVKPLARQPYHGHWNGHCNYIEIRAAELYRQNHVEES